MQIFLITIFLALLGSSVVFSSAPNGYPDQVTSLPNFSGSLPTSYAGFAPLDSQNNSALFYWYFPAKVQSSTPVPTLLWLNGGPGSSSMFGLFVENGPFRIRTNSDGTYSVYSIDQLGKLQSWTAFYNVLFLDSPVGTGYSYTSNNSYTTTEDEVASNIWTALQYFLGVHTELANTNWYYTGESYAGRYLPAIAYWTLKFNDQIHAGQLQGQIMNLQGILVGDGFVLGVSQRITSIDASQAGNLLTFNQYKQAKTLAAECQQLAAMGPDHNSDAVDKCSDILGYLDSVSDIDALAINLSAEVTADLGANVEPYLNRQDVIQALHVSGSKKQGQLFNMSSDIVGQYMNGDILGNSLNYINYVLTRIQCLFYEGNLDAQDGSYGISEWFNYLDGSYPNINNATRNIWYINKVSAGTYTQYQNLTYVIVDFAGHFVPYFVLNTTVKMVEIFTQRNNNWNYYSGLTATPMASIMCNYMNKCNGNGACSNTGICSCHDGYGLADCSAQAIAIDSTKTYTLNNRGYLFFSVSLNGQDSLIQFNNEQGHLGVFYTAFRNGPVADYEEAEASLLPTKTSPSSRTLYLNAYGQKTGYITVHNSQYFNTVNFTIKVIPMLEQSTNQLVTNDGQSSASSKSKNISILLYSLAALMVISTIVVLKGYKKKSKSKSKHSKIYQQGQQRDELNTTLVE